MTHLDPRTIRERVAQLDAALQAGDYDALGRMTGERFMMVNPLASVLGKADWLAWLAADIRYDRIERQDERIRTYDCCAIVTAATHATMRVVGLFDGAPTIHSVFRTEIWSLDDGALMLEHIHLTRLE